MQYIKRENSLQIPLLAELEELYMFTSDKTITAAKIGLLERVFDSSLKPIQDLFNKYAGTEYNFKFADKRYEPLDLAEHDDKNIIVCFSGGKDSVAVVQHYIKQGYNVYLYHLKHITPAQSDEYLVAQQFADYWHLPLFIDTVKLSGYNDYVEHPMKNMVIANGALLYGIENGIGTKIAFGNYTTSSLEDDNFEYCGGDCYELWDCYNQIIQRIIPNFEVLITLENLGQTLDLICSNKDILDMTVSCIGRANLRQHKRAWVKKKYDIIIPKHRCGQCYKCCVEYIYMAEHGLQDYNVDYYKYCLGKLKQNYEAEEGRQVTDDEVWNRYFIYPKEQSKLVEEN